MAQIIRVFASVFAVAVGVAPPAVLPPPVQPAALSSAGVASQLRGTQTGSSSMPMASAGSTAPLAARVEPPMVSVRIGLKDGNLMDALSVSQPSQEAAAWSTILPEAQPVYTATAPAPSWTLLGGCVGVFMLAAVSAAAIREGWWRRQANCSGAANIAAATEMTEQPKLAVATFSSEASKKGDEPVQLTRRESAAAAILAASLAAPDAAHAEGAKFSVFGFGDGTSDAYAQIDADQPNPYNQFSNPKDRIFKQNDPVYIDRAKKALNESFSRLEKVPKLIKGKESENLKSLLTLQLYTMRQNVEFITTGGPPGYRNDDETTPAFKKKEAFFQDIADLGAATKNKRWADAQTYYNNAMIKLEEWKKLVGF